MLIQELKMQAKQLLNSASILLLSIFVIVPNETKAIQPLTLEELNVLCLDYSTHPQQSESKQCARYIKGFIDGAIAADAGVRNDQSSDVKETANFSQRATKNRIGSRIKTLADNDNSVFCLGDPIIITDVISSVTANIKHIEDQNGSALGAVFEILKDKYPCRKL